MVVPLSSHSTYRTCGACGARLPVGASHNARTCRTASRGALPTPNTAPPPPQDFTANTDGAGIPTPHTQLSAFVDEAHKKTLTAHLVGNEAGSGIYPEVEGETPPPGNDNTDSDEPPTISTYTVEEIGVLWALRYPQYVNVSQFTSKEGTALSTFLHDVIKVTAPQTLSQFLIENYYPRANASWFHRIIKTLGNASVPHVETFISDLSALVETEAGEYNFQKWRNPFGFPNEDREWNFSTLRELIAESKFTPPKTLLTLAHLSHETVKGIVASNPSTPPEILQLLSCDESPRVRESCAMNPRTPPTALRTLSRDTDVRVIAQVAGNATAPTAVLSALARHPSTKVRQTLLTNNHATARVVRKTLRYSRWYRRKNFTATTQHEEEKVWKAAAQNPLTPRKTLKKLMELRHFTEFVAMNPALTAHEFTTLTHSTNADVRAKVACNPSLPRTAAETLTHDPQWRVRLNLAANPHTPPHALAELSHSSDTAVVVAVARNPATSPTTLAQLGSSPSSGTRYAVALNPHTPPDTLSSLCDDDNLSVRDTAQENPSTPHT